MVVAWLAALLTDLSLRFPDDRSLHLMALCVCHGIPMVTVFLCIYIYSFVYVHIYIYKDS